MDEIKTFLDEYNNELQQSPTQEENFHPKIVGNYCLDRKDVSNQIIDWVLNYLENRKCPYQLAVAVAKKTTKQMVDGISEQWQENNVDPQKLLNSFTLYYETLKRLPSVCNSFMEQVNEEICSPSCSFSYTTSVFAIKNKRRKMEDRHVIHHDLNLLLDLKDVPAHSYYAVFDGHSGVDAASYASAHLHVNIAKHPAFLTDTPTAIAEAYKITDESFLKKCSEENLKSGSTAVCALIRENTVYLSWLGDSQAVLVKGGEPVFITDPHKPERPDERKRIESLGGTVTNTGIWRVNGILAVTRALGDPDHKPYISGEPEMTKIELDGTEDFLILACDGLWDGMSPEDVTSTLYYNLSESALDEPLDAVAAKLVHKSKLQGSEDNISAIVVFLRDIKAIKDYAAELLSQTCSQINFLQLNGEGKHGMEGAACVKPTVLELNAASTKKLKNTANVLSSTCFPCPVYSESDLDGNAFQNINDNSIFVHHQNVASCFAPEATALSELPTPPIDDVLASQQFEKLCSADLFQGLNSISSEQSNRIAEAETNVFNSGVFDSIVDVQPFCSEHHIPKDLPEKNSATDEITPDEAVDIASCVVSNTIETAVKCLSSSELYEPVAPVSTIKLNPYAKPFIPGEAPIQSGTEVGINSDNLLDIAHPSLDEQNVIKTQVSEINLLNDCCRENVLNNTIHSNLEEQIVTERISEISLSGDCSKENDINMITKDDNIEKKSESTSISENIQDDYIVEKSESALKSENIQKDEMKSEIQIVSPYNITGLASEFSELSLKSPQFPSGTEIKVDEKLTEQDYLWENIKNTNIICNETNTFDVQDKVKEKESEGLDHSLGYPQFSNVPQMESFDNLIDETNVLEKIKHSEESNAEISALEDMQDIVKKEKDVTHCEDPSQTIELNQAKTSEHGESIAELNETGLKLSPQIENLITGDHEAEFTGECLMPKELSPSDILAAGDCKGEIVLESENPHSKKIPQDYVGVENYDALSDACINLTDPEKSQIDLHSKIQSTNLSNEYPEGSLLEGKHVSPDEATVAGISLESVSFGSLNIVGVNDELLSTEAVLPPDTVDEGPVETFAVDLQAIPVGVPEAEGVTEDIDSDSEKDGGWSYMKGHIIGSSGKPKPEESTTKVEKSTSKPESISNLKKDFSKSTPDNKSKGRNLTSIDKTKRPLLEKRALDIKDKNKVTKTASSTLPKDASKSTLSKPNVDKLTKPVSTVTRVKKEVSITSSVNKVSATAPTTSTSKVSTTAPIASANKFSTIVPSKPSRPTTLLTTSRPITHPTTSRPITHPTTSRPITHPTTTRSTTKAAAPVNKERNIGSVKPTTSMAVGANIRPKSALSSNGTKASSRLNSASTLLSKAQPPNQSKANVAPTARSTTLNRPVASTVPNRALTKPSTLSKLVAPEPKVKQIVSTIKKTELKKPDVKETKDIVNKQISARRNGTLNTISKSETIKSATTSNKRAMTLSNKPVPSKTRSAPVKTEVSKKDVPKPATSRLTTRTTTTLKNSPSATKGSHKKAVTVQDKMKKSELSAAGDQTPAKATPSCEEEKFILEVNDKEVIESAKEKDEISEIVDQKLNCLENGIIEKSLNPLEEIIPPSSAASENLL